MHSVVCGTHACMSYIHTYLCTYVCTYVHMHFTVQQCCPYVHVLWAVYLLQMHVCIAYTYVQYVYNPEYNYRSILLHSYYKSLSLSLYIRTYIRTYAQQSKSDCSNFDDDFTMEDAKITPPDESVFKTLDQTAFLGFSYTNERFHD